MDKIDEDIVFKTLSFIKQSDNHISRYKFDKYITTSFLIEESFNAIPKFLLENKFIEIIRVENDFNISLTKEGNNFITLKAEFEAEENNISKQI